ERRQAERAEQAETEVVDLGDHDLGAALAAHEADQRADGTAAEHEDAIAALHAGAGDVVRGHRERLDHRRRVVAERVGDLQEMLRSHRIVLAHAAGEVDAEHLELIAETRGAHATRAAGAAAHDRLDHDAVAGCKPAVLRRLDDLGERLVADDAAARNTVIEVTLVDVEVGTADVHPSHPQQCLAAGRRWNGYGRLRYMSRILCYR